ERLGDGGVVRSVELRVEALLGVAAAARRAGAPVRGVLPSPLPGSAGNHEYFLWMVAPDPADPGRGTVPGQVPDTRLDERGGEEIAAAVRAAVTAELPVLVGTATPAPPGSAGPSAGPAGWATHAVGGQR